MRFDICARAGLLVAIGVTLLGSASCIEVNERLGENLIPTDQKWHVFTPESRVIENISLRVSDSLSAYSSRRFTFGSYIDPKLGATTKSTSFTLVPTTDTLDFGKNTKILQFHLSAVRDTVSTVKENQKGMLQNIYVTELKKPLDSTVLYVCSFSEHSQQGRENRKEYINDGKFITAGTYIYDGGDSLSFDFSKAWAEKMVAQIKEWQKLEDIKKDTLSNYLKYVPGICISTDMPAAM